MNYELAKQLKDAGFPQPDPGNYQCETIHAYHYESPEHDADVHFPTLLELIEACGDRGMFELKREWSGEDEGWTWKATTPHLTLRLLVSAKGSTTEEAVANLWISLNS